MQRCALALILWLGWSAAAPAAPPVAVDDEYETEVGDNLSVDEPGVLDNDDDPDGDPLTAILVDPPLSGGVVNLFDDGSFEYEPPGAFSGTDTFTYRAYDGAELSEPATVTVVVSGGTPQLAIYLDETAFLTDLATSGYEATQESFEDEAAWGDVRSTISGGTFTAPAVTSLGVRWTSSNDTSQVTTGPGPARTGSWGFFSLPHGDYATGVDCHLPGNCTDGFVATSSPRLFAAGGWIRGIFGSKIELILDGARVVGFGDDATVGSAYKFFGVIDPDGFSSVAVHELEGVAEDAKYLWADDFTLATLPGVWLTALPGPGPIEVTLQWLGVGAGFSVYRSPVRVGVVAPGNLLGTTASRSWTDVPPPGEIFYFQVVPD